MKSCPRCHGDVQVDSDNFGAYARCLQCGFVRDLPARKVSDLRVTQAQPASVPPPDDDEDGEEIAYREAV